MAAALRYGAGEEAAPQGEQKRMFKNALITGASSGIGRSLALGLAKQGIEVVIAARRQPELQALRQEIEKAGGIAHVAVLDVARPREAVAEIQRFDDKLGGLDMVIANAGIGRVGSFKKATWDKIEAMCQVNFTGAIATLTALVPRMVTRRRGHLVGVSSLIAHAPHAPGSLVYQATKIGFSAFLDGLRFELAGTGVAVTAIHPGFVQTEMTAPNKHPMPFVMTVEQATERILRTLSHAPGRIDFPLPMTLLTKAAAMIPDSLTSAISARLKIG